MVGRLAPGLKSDPLAIRGEVGVGVRRSGRQLYGIEPVGVPGYQVDIHVAHVRNEVTQRGPIWGGCRAIPGDLIWFSPVEGPVLEHPIDRRRPGPGGVHEHQTVATGSPARLTIGRVGLAELLGSLPVLTDPPQPKL